MRKHLVAVVVLLVGTAATASAAAILHMPARDSLNLAAIAGGAALVMGAAGTLVLWFMRSNGIRVQIAIVALTCLLAVGLGTATAAQQMFISSHDLRSLAVVLVAAGTISVVTAIGLGMRVGRDAAKLADAARRVSADHVLPNFDPPDTRELASVAKELESMLARIEEGISRERALDASRRELIAWVSHDLRTPLSGIRAMAEALEDGVVSDKPTVERYHQTIRIEVDRLSGLVDDLFELSRINAGALRLQMERVSLEDLVSDTLAAAAGVARAKGVRLEGRVETAPVEVDLSAPEMMRAFRNLVENAIRHTPSDGTVSVEVGADEGQAIVAVSDSCGGIPDADIDRVFDVAFRGEAARSPGGDGGAGLGLAIAKGIVEAHHGYIEVENRADGCRFTVRLPRERSSGKLDAT
ncbi:MAG: sensor histidine kinase [Actinomycetota bacterium]